MVKVPPAPGESPIPAGYVRLFHYFDYSVPADQLLESIRAKGIDISLAKGETYKEPNMVWGSTVPPGEHKVYAEFAVAWNDPRWLIGKPSSPQDADRLNNGNFDVSFRDSIRPDEILAVHLDWHNRYRYIVSSDLIDDTLNGKFDYLLADKGTDWNDIGSYQKAILAIKENYGSRRLAKAGRSFADKERFRRLAERLVLTGG